MAEEIYETTEGSFVDSPESLERMERYQAFLALQNEEDGLDRDEYADRLRALTESDPEFLRGSETYGNLDYDPGETVQERYAQADARHKDLYRPMYDEYGHPVDGGAVRPVEDMPGTVVTEDDRVYDLDDEMDEPGASVTVRESLEEDYDDFYDYGGYDDRGDVTEELESEDDIAFDEYGNSIGAGSPEAQIAAEDLEFDDDEDISSRRSRSGPGVSLYDENGEARVVTSGYDPDLYDDAEMGAAEEAEAEAEAVEAEAAEAEATAVRAAETPEYDEYGNSAHDSVQTAPETVTETPESENNGAGISMTAATVSYDAPGYGPSSAGAPAPEPVMTDPEIITHQSYESHDFLDELSMATGLAGYVETYEYIPPQEITPEPETVVQPQQPGPAMSALQRQIDEMDGVSGPDRSMDGPSV